MKKTPTLSKFKKPTLGASFPDQVLAALRKVLPDENQIYPLHEPVFGGREREYLKDCIDTRMVSSVGGYVDKFERMLEEFTGARHAVAVVNGTAGIHIALKLSGVLPGDEVLVPAMTFVASANAVTYCGASPHFVDSEEQTLGLDPDKLCQYLKEVTERRSGACIHKKTGKVIRAMLPMHAFGHPVRMEECLRVARDFRITLVEDAAESIGSLYQGKHTGTFGTLGVLSFNGNKTITTGGGGAILTNNTALAGHAKHLTTTAKIPHPWKYQHDAIGYNYRLPNLNAALGCAQLEKLSGILLSKRKLLQSYRTAFAPVEGLKLFSEPEHCHSNYWLQTILLNLETRDQKEEILKVTNDAGIKTRPAWELLHTLPPFRSAARMNLSGAILISERLINLPSSVCLNDSKLENL